MARPKLGDSDTERLHLKITSDEIKAIDDWRYANRIPSRSEALRRLAAIAVLLDNDINELTRELKRLWTIREIGSDAILSELAAGQDWEKVATKAMATLSEMVEPQTILSERLFAILHQVALLKSSSELRDSLLETEKIKNASRDRIKQIVTALASDKEEKE